MMLFVSHCLDLQIPNTKLFQKALSYKIDEFRRAQAFKIFFLELLLLFIKWINREGLPFI
jgi:hypothetical protein